jgi:methylthioribose-1-phosphate isomerase
MKVRGAPAIAICGVLSIAVELIKRKFQTINEIKQFASESLDYLVTARPTAVNMADSANKLKEYCIQLETKLNDPLEYKEKYVKIKFTIYPYEK